jgi:cytochrome c peroxidase
MLGMSRTNTLVCCSLLLLVYFVFVAAHQPGNEITERYQDDIILLSDNWKNLTDKISSLASLDDSAKISLKKEIHGLRVNLKTADFWLRYYEPLLYKKINAPLPVEWETEVFEKFEKPYKREGAGLILAELYLEEEGATRDSLMALLQPGLQSLRYYQSDSLRRVLHRPDQFLYANRLFLLNLATIYTSAFECPDPERIIPELQLMLQANREIYLAYNKAFPNTKISDSYLLHYDKMIEFVNGQPMDHMAFDHFIFIRDYVNVLFSMNQEMLRNYRLPTRSFNDYSLTKAATSIFSKNLFIGQNRKGVYTHIDDPDLINEIKETGRLLFFDPLLSGNGKRSCASCHKPEQCFTDTLRRTALAFDGVNSIQRNTPTLVNLFHNHLIMQDGKHYLVEDQLLGVITNPLEMGCSEKQLVQNVMSCDSYKKSFKKYVRYTPSFPEISPYHITSALMVYLSDYSDEESLFDKMMNKEAEVTAEVRSGFNLFMSKAQCGTCHFAPIFNGVKPPYVGSEFEVLGVPADSLVKGISPDSGRYGINPAKETFRAFRTGTLRNISRTAPYMHNGVFATLDQVLAFYNHGGGAGQGLDVPNQTLSSDSLHLTSTELQHLKSFMLALNEEVIVLPPPVSLPASRLKQFEPRIVGGNY